MKNPFDIIRTPIITEKAGDAKERYNKITFAVDRRSGKREIKHAVETAFKVEVEKVNVLNIKGKVKRLGRISGKRPDWKKAIVTLREGSTIEVLDQI